MLVLTRKVGEKIVIPELDITLVVLRIRGREVRLGIMAPQAISVRREELTPNTVNTSSKR